MNHSFKKITVFCFIVSCVLCLLDLMNFKNVATFLFFCLPVFVLIYKNSSNRASV